MAGASKRLVRVRQRFEVLAIRDTPDGAVVTIRVHMRDVEGTIVIPPQVQDVRTDKRGQSDSLTLPDCWIEVDYIDLPRPIRTTPKG
jgi:hypothetical protein